MLVFPLILLIFLKSILQLVKKVNLKAFHTKTNANASSIVSKQF